MLVNFDSPAAVSDNLAVSQVSRHAAGETTSPPLLQVCQVSKSFDGTPVLRQVSFEVAPREIVCLLGPSGCGKSTLLNIITGLEQADNGDVLVNGQSIAGVAVHRRGFGLMFQGLALFPHRNVRDNVAFGLHILGQPKEQIDARVGEVLELVGLSGFELRDVNQLSGGEQQRVALARSLAPRPRLLMLDEPLSSLDRALRERLMIELRDILTRVGQTAIYVTHDQQEAFAIADRVVIMNAGRIEQTGTPRDVYLAPANAFVAYFLGLTNLIDGHVTGEGANMVDTALGRLTWSATKCHPDDVTVLIRPEALIFDGSDNILSGVFLERSFRGRQTRVAVRVHSLTLEFEVDSALPLPEQGATARFSLRPDRITCLG
jgi:ABC-type Fe3+/spermidine/putrescine transport system ATPase subunit